LPLVACPLRFFFSDRMSMREVMSHRLGASIHMTLRGAVQAVRSCVLIKFRPKKKIFPSASYGHLVRRASDQKKKGEKIERPKILERLL